MEIDVALADPRQLRPWQCLTLAYLGRSLAQFSAAAGGVAYARAPLVLSEDELLRLLPDGAALLAQSNVTLLLNSYLNLQLFEFLPVAELNPREAKSADLALQYVGTGCVGLCDLLTGCGRCRAAVRLGEQVLDADVAVRLARPLPLRNATVGTLNANLAGFLPEYQVPGHQYVIELENGALRLEQQMEFRDGRLQQRMYAGNRYAGYQELALQAAALCEALQQLLAGPRDRRGAPAPQYRVYQEPVEMALLDQRRADNFDCRVYYGEADRQRFSPRFGVRLLLREDLAEKLAAAPRKAVDKPPAPSPFYAPFAYPGHRYTRRQLYSTLEVPAADCQEYQLQGELAVEGADKILSLTVGRQQLIPLELREQAALAGSQRARKDARADRLAQFADGAPNHYYLNRLQGIQRVAQCCFEPLPNVAPLSPQTPFIARLLDEYAADMESAASARAAIEKLYRVLDSKRRVAGAQGVAQIYPVLELRFHFPICLQLRQLAFPAAERRVEPDPPFRPDVGAEMHRLTLQYLRYLQDVYFVTAYQGFANVDEKVGNMAQQKALKKLQLNKQFGLRGIQGMQQSRTYTPASQLPEQVEINFQKFQLEVQADGYIEQLTRGMRPLVRRQLLTGFACRNDVVGFLTQLTQGQVTDRIFDELKQQKLLLKQQREAEERLALISMAASQERGGRPGGAGGVRLNGELSNALLRINQQMELEKRIRGEEQLLQVEARPQLSPEQLQLRARIEACLYYAAANEPGFSRFAYAHSSGILGELLGDQRQPLRTQLQRLSEAFPGSDADVQALVYANLLAAYQLSQPMRVAGQADLERVAAHVKAATAFVLQAAAHQPQLVGVDSAILAICALVGEQDWEVRADQDERVRECRDELAATVRQAPARSPPQRPVDDPRVTMLVEVLLLHSEHFLQNYMVNFSLTSDERYRPMDHKSDILAALGRGEFRSQDIELFFEILGMAKWGYRAGEAMTILDPELAAARQGAEKRNHSDLGELAARPLGVRPAQVPEHVVGTFLYALYRFGHVRAATLSRLLQRAIDAMIGRYDDQFRRLVERVQELDIVASVESFPRLPEMQDANPLLRRNESVLSCTTNKEKQQLTQSIFAKLRAIRKSTRITKFQTQQHLLAVEEAVLQQRPDLSRVTATLEKFQSEEEFMQHLMNSAMPKQEKASRQLSTTALIALAEYLSLRSETTVAARLLRHARAQIPADQEQNTVVQYQQLRCQFVQLRVLYLGGQYDDVVKLSDALHSQSGQIASRIRACPAISYYKAQALFMMAEAPGVTSIGRQNLLQEVFKNAYYSYIQSQKVKDYDEFFKGSTSIGESAFLDFGYALKLCELLTFSINLEDFVVRNKDVQASELSMTQSVKALPNLLTSTAFLHQNFPSKFGETPTFASLRSGRQSSKAGDQASAAELAQLLSPAPQSAMSKQLFQSRREELQRRGNETPEKPHFSEVEASSQRTYLDYVRSSATLHTDENFEKDKGKMVFLVCGAVKQLLERNPGFGPAWSLLALLQAVLKNGAEARLSASIATVMAPFVRETWAVWVVCEVLNAREKGENAGWVLRHFRDQVESMDIAQSTLQFLWRFVMRMTEEGE